MPATASDQYGIVCSQGWGLVILGLLTFTPGDLPHGPLHKRMHVLCTSNRNLLLVP